MKFLDPTLNSSSTVTRRRTPLMRLAFRCESHLCCLHYRQFTDTTEPEKL